MLRPSVADAAFDATLFAELRAALARGELSPERSRLSRAPAPLDAEHCTAVDELAVEDRAVLRRRGAAAIAAGEVAALVLNGGMATRFGGVVKGVVPVVPGRDDLSFLAVKLAGLRRVGVPVVLMHSFATAAATREHLAAIDWAGIPVADRLEFSQSILPRVLPDGTPLPALPDADELADSHLYAAPGHGDTLRRVRDSGVLEALAARGVRHVLVSNVDNLGATLDPVVLGAHLAAVDGGAAMSVEVVLREPGDAGGCVATVAGKPQILEGFRLPAGTDLADYPHFNTNTLWIAVDALRGEHPLQWFPVRRALEWPDGSCRDIVQFEQLIGQLSEHVDTAYLLVDRARFLPIKTREDLAAAGERLAGLARAAGLSV
ncbi:MAG: UTP--glucose-1-phosphate uridylyltransferase [Myxococcales bacterium]|nr:UTP--glucose-1-phosphate uridylyltransferase [Myxococcales bacterium]